MEAIIAKYYDMDVGDLYPIYTKDFWVIPESGTTLWKSTSEESLTVIPVDECHVDVSSDNKSKFLFHCDELINLLEKRKKECNINYGFGVPMERHQFIEGNWRKMF